MEPSGTSQPVETEDSPVAPDSPSTVKQSRMISSVLSPAIRFWLRSQLEHVEDLQLAIEASDRQILSGALQRVAVSARKAIYRGLHVSQVRLTGKQISTNLGQVVRGKPFRLLQAFPVFGEVFMQDTDLNASLASPLLGDAVIDFLLTLLKAEIDPDNVLGDRSGQSVMLQDPQVVLNHGDITLTATLIAANGNPIPIAFRTGLRVTQGNQLHLDRPHWLPHATAKRGLALTHLDGYTFDLGSQVVLEELSLESGQIVCRGQMMVIPEA